MNIKITWKNIEKILAIKKMNILNGTNKPMHLKLHTQIRLALH
jgi:hypothetical protein